jgi:hypothetical protein
MIGSRQGGRPAQPARAWQALNPTGLVIMRTAGCVPTITGGFAAGAGNSSS